MINKNDSLGIPNYGVWYLETLPNQIAIEEMQNIHRFLNKLVRSKVAPELSENMEKGERNIILGKKIKCPMTDEEIEEGIKLGIELKNRENLKQIQL